MNSNITSRFDLAAEIATIALDEFKSHHVHWNYTGLIQRYYHLVERDFGAFVLEGLALQSFNQANRLHIGFCEQASMATVANYVPS